MSVLTGSYKRAKSLLHQSVEREADCRVERSENGEMVIYTGIVMTGKRYRNAEPEEQMDYILIEELKELEKKDIQFLSL